ncbi:hydantoinase/oxoprolinase family protein [Paraburkholderia susongensis]|uniref:N-methylhydantoinase A n=1 Tax=Paraburkholderia susongensis TaxID=1515439 RepID=A0A1X7JFL5_9BURK|nr:hydantoinase/oxoprolinase family protein [Paraburkholderia susongensis]SMG26563.1 N-methylhydantoinase A [Paraburkholderia susongensis]
MENTKYRLGIDIGGTFTDFCLLNEDSGETLVAKVPSTPRHPSQAVMDGLARFSEQHDIRAQDVRYFVHGTTLGVNTLLERKGARTGLLITRGFLDIMSLGRSRLPDVFDLLVEKPRALIARRHVREINERVMAGGDVLIPLDLGEVVAAARELVADGVTALTITFLHSYRHPRHEQMAKQAIERALPGLYVCCSTEIWPQIREYERTMVSAINAYIGGKMDAYFAALTEETKSVGLGATLLSTKSNGGVMTAASARRTPVETLSSGPASGAIGACYVALQSGFSRLIPMDMGGTSTEVAVIDTDIRYANQCHIGDFDISMPAVDLSSIGAGGGSIAWTDGVGVLKVGPESSGSDPGPACYGRGGTRPTITDAYVTLGIIDPERFLGGEQKLDRSSALGVFGELSASLDMTREESAEAVLRVATSNMYSELVPLMARKGVDVSEFALLCYGGAGATHGFMLAREVGIRTVLVPLSPGTLCALGALVADAKSDFIQTVNLVIDPERPQAALATLRTSIEALSATALRWIDDERIRVEKRDVGIGADMRYLGQSFEVTVALDDIDPTSPAAYDAIANAFRKAYNALYGDGTSNAPLEIINLRVSAIGRTTRPLLPRLEHDAAQGELRAQRQRDIYIDGKVWRADVYDRAALRPGHRFASPAIVEQYDTTSFIPPGFQCRVDDYGMIIGELQ